MRPLTPNPAPVCLFAFNRPDKTAQTLAALKANRRAFETELYVFLDGPRGDADVGRVEEVAALISQQTGFAGVHLSRRESNADLARSIIEGVTVVMKRHGRAIILEDDIVTSPVFLDYMNHALDAYSDCPEVWHISGYNEDFGETDPQPGASFLRFMSCWGWASWADRWNHFERDPEALINRFSAEDIRRFNLDGAQDFWSQVVANANGEINTWAIFWYATIFERGGLCLSPNQSYTENIGFDGTGTHSEFSQRPRRKELNLEPQPLLPTVFVEDSVALERLRAYYMHKPTGLAKLKRELRRAVWKLSKGQRAS